eukprot:2652881-Prymnesium_polylepis.2
MLGVRAWEACKPRAWRAWVARSRSRQDEGAVMVGVRQRDLEQLHAVLGRLRTRRGGAQAALTRSRGVPRRY